MNNEKIEEFENGNISRLVLNNAVPSMIGMVMVLVYNLADTFFIGQTNNPLMVAAVSQATPVFSIFMSVGVIFGIGGTSLISRLLGLGDRKEAKHVSSFAFWTGLVIGIIGMFFIIFGVNPITNILGADAGTLEYVKSYLLIVAYGVPFLVVSNTFSNILRSEGKPKKAMMGMVLGNLTNIILDPIFILLFNFDVRGVAIATVLGNIVSAVFYISHFVGNKSYLSIRLSDFKCNRSITWGVLSIGIPASLNSFLVGISAIFINNFLISYGNMAVAAMGVASKMGMLLAILLVGFGLGVQPLFGYFYGSRNRERFISTLKVSLIYSTLISLVLSVFVQVGVKALVGAFLTDDEAFLYGVQFSKILTYSGPVLGALFIFNNAVQGMGKALPSLILSVSRQGLIYIPMLFIIDRLSNSPSMLIFAQTLSDYITIGLATILFLSVFNKNVTIAEKENAEALKKIKEVL